MRPRPVRPTIEDVASASAVSVATVSRALRGLPNVAPATRDRVRAVAADLKYEIDPSASRLASGRTMTIGLVAPFFGTWYADRVVMGAESVLAAAGYDLLVASVRDEVGLDRFLERARAFGRRVDGVLLIDLYLAPEPSTRLEDLGVPVVSVGEELGAALSITIENEAAAAVATRHLVALGHRRIGCICGRQSGALVSPIPGERLRGWAAALGEAGLTGDDELVVDGGFTVAGGSAAMATLLDLDDPPTAVFSMSDRMAVGALVELGRRGLSVPRDMSIVGFDDDDLADAFGITTVHQPVNRMGQTAASVLLDLVAGEDRPDREVLEAELVTRVTTGPRHRSPGPAR